MGDGRVSGRRMWLGVFPLLVGLTACGHVSDDPTQARLPEAPSTITSSVEATSSTPTTSLSVPPRTTATTGASTSAAGCLGLLAKEAQLMRDFRSTMTGIRGPTPEEEAQLRARGRALLAEAHRLGCRVPPGLPT